MTPNTEILSDEQIKDRCASAGIRWIDPIPDYDGEEGYPGGFDMCSMAEMRALLAATLPSGIEADGDGGKGQKPVALLIVQEGEEDEFFWQEGGLLLDLPPGEYDLYLSPTSPPNGKTEVDASRGGEQG